MGGAEGREKNLLLIGNNHLPDSSSLPAAGTVPQSGSPQNDILEAFLTTRLG